MKQSRRRKKHRLKVLYILIVITSISCISATGLIAVKILEQKYKDETWENKIFSFPFEVSGAVDSETTGYFGNGGTTSPIETENETNWLTEKGYPESLVTLYEKNEEARDFVLGYFENKNNDSDIDISEEVLQDNIPTFYQWDKRWGYQYYGNDFFAVTGCGPTCLSMVYCGLTKDMEMNPYEMGKLAEQNGYYVAGAGSSWNMMTSLAEYLGLTAEEVIYDEYHIEQTLKNGNPIICVMGPGRFTTEGHYIVLTGITENGQIEIHDPNSKKNTEMTWNLSDLMAEMNNLWSYSY